MKFSCSFWTPAEGVRSIRVDLPQVTDAAAPMVRRQARDALVTVHNAPRDLILERCDLIPDEGSVPVVRRTRGYGGWTAYGPVLDLVAGGQWWAGIELLGRSEFEPDHEVASLAVMWGRVSDRAPEEESLPLIALQPDQVRALRDACSAWLDDRPGV